jgi:hypothetical protein
MISGNEAPAFRNDGRRRFCRIFDVFPCPNNSLDAPSSALAPATKETNGGIDDRTDLSKDGKLCVIQAVDFCRQM